VFYFSFISHVRASEIKLKQCFLFQFYFRRNSRITVSVSSTVSVTNLFSTRKLRHKNAIGGATWEWGANCPCDGGSSMSSSETWNTEVCCTVIAHVVIHSRFVV